MPGRRKRGEKVRQFILDNVEQFPTTIAHMAARKFRVTRQSISVHMNRLYSENLLTATNQTSARSYSLAVLKNFRQTYQTANGLREDEILETDILSKLDDLPKNAVSIWSTAFTEMYNNVLDHSEATQSEVEIRATAVDTEMTVHDNGIGVFNKIQRALKLTDKRYAIVELSKGKLTTDRSKHSGEGIFFTSRMFDKFDILSDGLSLRGDSPAPAWVLENAVNGTTVWMKLNNKTTRQAKDVYDSFTEDFDFNKTNVPVRLSKVSGGDLVSRSQAKRILSGLEKFKEVTLDFSGVEWVGQAFADEIFRVYLKSHPEVTIKIDGANDAVTAMVERAKNNRL